jgi:methionyl aminopeptidase
VLCASVNDAALHDIPGRYRLRDGDLLSIDCGATLDGWTADAAISVQVGRSRPEDTRLIGAAAEALAAGIAAAVPGGRLGDISAAIGAAGHGAGYGVPAGFGGHGIGHTMHEDPHIPDAGRPGRGLRLVPGLVRALSSASAAGASAAPIRSNIAGACRSRSPARATRPATAAQRARPASAWASSQGLPIARASSSACW